MIADVCFTLLRLEVVSEILEVFVSSHPPFGQLVRLSAWPNNTCPRFFRLSGALQRIQGNRQPKISRKCRRFDSNAVKVKRLLVNGKINKPCKLVCRDC